MASFLTRLATSANQIGEKLRGIEEARRLDYVRKIYEEADVVFGVWPDVRRGENVGFRVLKGARLMEGQTGAGGPEMRVAAVPFENEKHAVEISESFGAESWPSGSRRARP